MPFAKMPCPVTTAFVPKDTQPNPVLKLLANKLTSQYFVSLIMIARITRNASKANVSAKKDSLLKELPASISTNVRRHLADLSLLVPTLPVAFTANAKADTSELLRECRVKVGDRNDRFLLLILSFKLQLLNI